MKNSPLFPFLHYSLFHRDYSRRSAGSEQVNPALRHSAFPSNTSPPFWRAPRTTGLLPAALPVLLTLTVITVVAAVQVQQWGSKCSGPLEFVLQADVASPKLKATPSAAAPRTALPPASVEWIEPEPARSLPGPLATTLPEPELVPPPPAVPAPLPIFEAPPALEPPSPRLVKADLQVPRGPATPALLPGDTPMLRNWKQLGVPTLLVCAFTALPVQAGGGDGPGTEDKTKTLESKLDRKFDELKKELTDIFTRALEAREKERESKRETREKERESKLENTFLMLDKRLETMSKDIKTLREMDVPGVQRDLQVLKDEVKLNKDQIANLQKDVDELKKRVSQEVPIDKAMVDRLLFRLDQLEKSLAQQTNVPQVTLRPPSTTARIVLVNSYNEEVRFTIEGRTYTLTPGETFVVESLQPGPVSYTADTPNFGVFRRNTVTLSANETFTITARP